MLLCEPSLTAFLYNLSIVGHFSLLGCLNLIVTQCLGLSPPRVVMIRIINGATDAFIFSCRRTGKSVIASPAKCTDTDMLDVQVESIVWGSKSVQEAIFDCLGSKIVQGVIFDGSNSNTQASIPKHEEHKNNT
ncbi:unnamed protein product [Mucor circinelloides]